MGADSRPHMIDDKLLDAKTLLHQLLDIFRVFDAVAVADEYHIILVLVFLDLVRHAVYQSGKGFLTAPDLSNGDQMP